MGKLSSSLRQGTSANKFRFGAVLEEFEVRDALESVFHTKPEFNGHL